MHVSGLNFKAFHVTISKVPHVTQGVSSVLSFIMMCHCFNAVYFFTLTGPPKWNLSLAYSKFLNTVKKLNIPQIKVETASLTPAVIQGILIAPEES